MRRLGAEGPSFPSIVAAGAHGALPHAEPRDEQIPRDVLVTIDWGALHEGYCSDCTRTYATGEGISEQAREVYELVLPRPGRRRWRPSRAGPSGRELDAVARAVIEQAGHGEHFGHGLGHGVGMEIHEGPRLSRTAGEEPLLAGNVVTVEPGVYLPGGLRRADRGPRGRPRGRPRGADGPAQGADRRLLIATAARVSGPEPRARDRASGARRARAALATMRYASGAYSAARARRQRQRPGQEERRLRVRRRHQAGSHWKLHPRQHACSQREHGRARARPAHLPGEQGEHERQRVVDGVPGDRSTAAQRSSDQREREQRVALASRGRPRRGVRRPGRRRSQHASRRQSAAAVPTGRTISGWLIVPVHAGPVR